MSIAEPVVSLPASDASPWRRLLTRLGIATGLLIFVTVMELARLASAEPIVAVVRGEHLHRFDDDRVATLQAGDRLICLSPAKDAP